MTNQRPSLTDWARQHATELRERSGRLSDNLAPSAVRHIAARGLEFLRVNAPGSEFSAAAEAIFGPGWTMSAPQSLEALGQILEGWASHVDEGLAASVPFATRARQEAATDLMEQVQRLLDEADVHVAAPVVLAGAALEEFLRGLIEGHPEAVVKGRPGLQSYAEALKTVDVLDAQAVKDVISIAGQRNDAAHGHFEKLSLERALLMTDQVNLFMRQHTATPQP